MWSNDRERPDAPATAGHETQHQVRRIPIVDDRGRLVGILAQADLARHAEHHPLAEERESLVRVESALSEPSHMPHR